MSDTYEDPLADYDPGMMPPVVDASGPVGTAGDEDLWGPMPDIAPLEEPHPPADDTYAPPLGEHIPEPWDQPTQHGSYGSSVGRRSKPRKPEKCDDPANADMTEKVHEVLRAVIAAHHGHAGAELIEMINYVLSSTATMEYLPRSVRRTYSRIAEVLISGYANDKNREVDLFDIPDLEAANGVVVAEVEAIRRRLRAGDLPKTPTSAWRALVNHVQRITAKSSALTLVAGIDADDTDEELMELFRTMQPPSASTTLQNATFSRSALDWEKADRQAEAEAAPYRISSGYPTLDYAFTLKDKFGNDAEPLGAWAPGEFHTIAAPTGNGKSACSRRLITAAAEDLVMGWGREHDRVLIAITEEAPKIVYRAAGLGSGQRYHHLAKNVVISNIGASRHRFVQAVYDCVIQAFHMAQETGLPIASCGMPSLIVLDYVGGIVEQGEGADTTAIERTANLILRGLCAWDPEMMAEFSGVSFAEYAGMSWPDGMENFRPAVIAFAQFKKLADPLWYDPTQKSCSLQDFVMEHADGSPGWPVQAGDFRLPTQAEVRGSGVLINHSTSLIILHRSRPQKNQKVVNPATGEVHLQDDRARWLLVKTRNGSDLTFVPMRFDSQPSGERGQFFDKPAEVAIKKGLLKPQPSWQEFGDPILPPRPVRTPFDGVVYA